MNDAPAAETGTPILRPIWRRFAPRFAERAADFVRAGGLAAIVHSETDVEVWLGVAPDGSLLPYAAWALLSIDVRHLARPLTTGPGAGLVGARLPDDPSLTVLDWCDRDGVHPRPERAMHLDCVACTACCQDANVTVGAMDLERFDRSSRHDLGEEPFVTRDPDGHVHLRFVAGRCPHLGDSGACAIYDLRPEPCRAFLPGSEPCLAAREDTLGVRDDEDDATAAEGG